MSDQRVLALLGKGVVPVDTPVLRADDLGALRGDGIFETMHVRAGRIWLRDQHLARMASSAARMELTLPPATELAELTETALAAWSPTVEGALRLVCTRGPEDGGPVTVLAMINPVGLAARKARHQGLDVLTADVGLPVGLRKDAPWLLGGAKTLSYAMNMACLRWATGRGADDVLWVSADGYALEAPTSTLVWLTGDTLCTVPPAQTGILPGTTAAYLVAHAGELGWRSQERLITPTELFAADGAWLTSSVRGVAPIHTLDGTALAWSPRRNDQIRELLGFE